MVEQKTLHEKNVLRTMESAFKKARIKLLV